MSPPRWLIGRGATVDTPLLPLARLCESKLSPPDSEPDAASVFFKIPGGVGGEGGVPSCTPRFEPRLAIWLPKLPIHDPPAGVWQLVGDADSGVL